MKTGPFLILTVIIFISFIPGFILAKSVEVISQIKEVLIKRTASHQTPDDSLVVY